MLSLEKLVVGAFSLVPAVGWRLVGGVALAVVFLLLAGALLWLAVRRLQSAPDGRDVGDDGLLGLVAADPVAPPHATAAAAREPAPAATPAPAVAVAPETAPERGLPVEVRPRVTAEDLPTPTTAADWPSLKAEAPPPEADAAPPAPANKPAPLEAAPISAPPTAVLSAPATVALPSPSAATNPLAQDIRERLARTPRRTEIASPPAESSRTSTTAPERAPVEARTAELREARLTERLPAQRKVLRPPQPPSVAPAGPPAPSPVPAAAPPAASPEPVPVQVIPHVAPPPPRPAAEVAPPRFLGDDRPTGIGREAVWLGVMLTLFVVVLGSLVVVFFPAARNRVLPPSWAERVAAIPRGLGLEAAPPSVPVKQVEVRQYANTYSSAPKGATGKIVRTVTIAGLVKNITNEKLYDLRAEIELYPREPAGAPPERRIIYLTPSLLEPGQEGRYTLTVADADYRQSSLKRIVSGDGKDIKEVPAVFIQGTFEPPDEQPAKPAPPDRPPPASRRRSNA